MADTEQEVQAVQESPPQGETADQINDETTSEAAGTDAEPSGAATE